MKEITLCIMTRELCHQFFREHKNDPAVYADESQFQPYVYSEDIANSFYERKQVPGRLGFVAGILKASGPGKHFINLNLTGSLCAKADAHPCAEWCARGCASGKIAFRRSATSAGFA